MISRIQAILLFVFISGTAILPAQNIQLLFTGVKSTKGQIILKVYTDEKSYQEDIPYKTEIISKQDLVQGMKTGKLNLEPGVYGFALLDDENKNLKMDYNLLGMPEEGFAFSNFYLSGMKRPHFSDFQFTVSKDQKLLITMKFRYL
jgi:uncharacterized protein (DUF2141 family)